MTKFVIEHLDPRVWKWSMVEYTHIFEFVGKENLIFTNVKSEKDREKLKPLGTVHEKSIKELKFPNMVILDPLAKETLNPSDKKFDYVVLGGVLGNYPMDGRTKKMISDPLSDYPARNLGKEQMSTNTAAYVSWKILTGTPIEKIEFVDPLIIPVNEYEELELPFKFVVENGKVVLPPGYIEMAKKKF